MPCTWKVSNWSVFRWISASALKMGAVVLSETFSNFYATAKSHPLDSILLVKWIFHRQSAMIIWRRNLVLLKHTASFISQIFCFALMHIIIGNSVSQYKIFLRLRFPCLVCKFVITQRHIDGEFSKIYLSGLDYEKGCKNEIESEIKCLTLSTCKLLTFKIHVWHFFLLRVF